MDTAHDGERHLIVMCQNCRGQIPAGLFEKPVEKFSALSEHAGKQNLPAFRTSHAILFQSLEKVSVADISAKPHDGDFRVSQ